MKRYGVITLALLASPTFLACSSADSKDIKTSGMYADITAASDGTNTHSQVILRVGGATSTTFVNLGATDTLDVTVGGTTTKLTENNLADFYFYSADLAQVADGTVFTFAFTRPAAETSAPLSRATLPLPFTMTSPTAANQSRAQAMTVTWAPAGTSDNMRLAVTGDCISAYARDISGDPGTYVVEANALTPRQGQTATSCQATITVTRTRPGTLDPAYGGGSVSGSQARTTTLRLDP